MTNVFYSDPCRYLGNFCEWEHSHIIMTTDDASNNDTCACACDEGYINNGTSIRHISYLTKV